MGQAGRTGRRWAWLGLYVAWKAQRRDRRGPEAGLAQLHARGKAGATSANTQQEQPVGTMDGALPLAGRRTVALSPNTIANTDNRQSISNAIALDRRNATKKQTKRPEIRVSACARGGPKLPDSDRQGENI